MLQTLSSTVSSGNKLPYEDLIGHVRKVCGKRVENCKHCDMRK